VLPCDGSSAGLMPGLNFELLDSKLWYGSDCSIEHVYSDYRRANTHDGYVNV